MVLTSGGPSSTLRFQDLEPGPGTYEIPHCFGQGLKDGAGHSMSSSLTLAGPVTMPVAQLQPRLLNCTGGVAIDSLRPVWQAADSMYFRL